MKAIEASINGHQWVKAVEILEVVDEDGDLDTKSHLVKYYLKLASHFCQVGDYKVPNGFFETFLFFVMTPKQILFDLLQYSCFEK